MKTCRYQFCNGNSCDEKPWQSSEFCILHIDLPEDEASEEFKEINEAKNRKVEEKLSKEDF
ncbi:MAG: hypothetical protein PHY70_04990, partial [Methanocellales archaeon]|nr:hypothetical protein [Methanocellales archaeon]